MVYVITPWQCLLDFNSQNLLVLKGREKILDRSVVVVMLNNDKQVKLGLVILEFFLDKKKIIHPPPHFFRLYPMFFFLQYFCVNNDGMKRIRVKDISSMFLLFKGICTHLAKLKKFNTDFYFEGDAG